MGVKVSSVKDFVTQKEVTVQDCENGYEGEYICKVEGCDTQMQFNKGYESRRFNKIIIVPSYFKLKPHKKHTYGICPFNTKGAIEIIARGSDTNILKSLNNDKYEFSLQVLHKPPSIALNEDKFATLNSNDLNNRGKTKKYTKKGTATSYIRVLSQILTLRAKVEDDKELALLVVLNYRGSKLKWQNFYFEVHEYENAYKIAEHTKKEYPMCFHGVISKITPANDAFKYSKVKVYSPNKNLEKDITSIPSLEFLISDTSLDLEQFPVGTEILGYGIVKTNTGNWVPPEQKKEIKPKIIKFLNMSCWVNHSEQLVKLYP